MKRRSRKADAHVRIYWYEERCLAWTTMSPDARALLVALRGLYRPSNGNVVFLSIREAMARLNIGQRRAQRAFSDLIERGWIAVETPGGFQQKTRHATSYRLANEATCAPGANPNKAYLRWTPAPADLKNTGNHCA